MWENARMMMSQTPLLDTLSSPDDLRRLPEASLRQLADELRSGTISAVAVTGGHLGAGLGVVELTVALHHVFDTPRDRLVWDVGHQCYPHKILTGRRDRITTIKKKNGLAPFPKREESEYDTFGVGHSSTSISAALGMAIANQRTGDDRKVVAVIGEHGKKMMKRDGFLWRFVKRWEEHAKGMFVPSTLFEELGFHYTGPIDGHDIPLLVSTIRTLKELKGPQLLHVITTKGKGYPPAEREQIEYHAVGPFDPTKGVVKKAATKQSYTEVFGNWLCDMAAADERLLAITPAMREGSGLVRYSKEFAPRYFDVGIAEQHAVTLAAGMACE